MMKILEAELSKEKTKKANGVKNKVNGAKSPKEPRQK